MMGEDFAQLGGILEFVGDAGLALFDPVEEKLGGAAADARGLADLNIKGGGGGEAEGGFLVGNGAEEEPSAGLQFYGGL